AEQTFEHAVGGFSLPALTVARTRQGALHHPSPITAWWFVRWSADQRRNEAADVTAAGVFMDVFSVVAGIGGQGSEANSTPGLVERLVEVREVRPRPALRNHGEYQVALAVADNAGFGKPGVGHRLLEILAFCLTAHVVGASVTGLQTRAVHRHQRQ